MRTLVARLSMAVVIASLAGPSGAVSQVSDAGVMTVDEVVARALADNPDLRAVRAEVGDLLHLTVQAPSPDVVELEGLGRFAPVDATSPARFNFFLESSGQFPIRLQESGREIGRLSVAAG